MERSKGRKNTPKPYLKPELNILPLTKLSLKALCSFKSTHSYRRSSTLKKTWLLLTALADIKNRQLEPKKTFKVHTH